MGRKDQSTSLKEAYIKRFHHRPASARADLIELDLHAARAIANPTAVRAFIQRYVDVGLTLNVNDVFFYGQVCEYWGRLIQAEGWYKILAHNKQPWTLRHFYVRRGMAKAALAFFKQLDKDELNELVTVNANKLKHDRAYDLRLIDECTRAHHAGAEPKKLLRLYRQCITDAQFPAAVRVLDALQRPMKVREAYGIGLAMIKRDLMGNRTFVYLKRLRVEQLSRLYVNALIAHSPDEPDLIRARAAELEYKIKPAQFAFLLKRIINLVRGDLKAVGPNSWVPIAEELAQVSADWKAKLPEIYDLACQQALYSGHGALAAHFAEKQGYLLDPFDLHIQYHWLHGAHVRGRRNETRTFVKDYLLERLNEVLAEPPVDPHGKRKPD